MPGITLRAGDALDPASIMDATADVAALVSAVTPFTAPPSSFDDFDAGYYSRIAETMDATAAGTGVERVVLISLFAALRSPAGGLVADDPTQFPEALRPFALAHHRGIDRLRGTGAGLDWLALAPPPMLHPEAPATGHYLLGDHTLDPRLAQAPLSYTDLATAVLDQIEHPTRHREHVAVYGNR